MFGIKWCSDFRDVLVIVGGMHAIYNDGFFYEVHC
jgi:hypothetical protein